MKGLFVTKHIFEAKKTLLLATKAVENKRAKASGPKDHTEM